MKRLAKEYIESHLKNYWNLSAHERENIMNNRIYPEKEIDLSEKVIILEFFDDDSPQGYELYKYSKETLSRLMCECSRLCMAHTMFNLRVIDKHGKAYMIKPTEFVEVEEFSYYY